MVNVLGVGFHIYGLLIGLGIWLAYEASVWAAKSINIDKRLVEEGLWWAVIPGLVGARLYHVIDLWEIYRLDWMRILMLWEGGLGIWGAIIGGMVGLLFFYVVKEKELRGKLLKLFDVAVIGLPLAQAIGRWGNFANGELYGKMTTLPWGMVVSGVEGRVHPLFLYESVLNLGLFGLMVWMVKSKRHKNGWWTGVYLVGYGVIRMVLEPLRPDFAVWIVGGLPVAQIVAMVAIFTGVGLLKKGTRRG